MKKSLFDLDQAHRHFKKHDPVMAKLLHASKKRVPALELPVAISPNKYFAHIVSSITSQQISVKAADAVLKRIKAGLGTITPETVNKATIDQLRSYGLSRQKAGYLKKSAEIWHTLPLRKFSKMTDEEVIEELTKLHGIGRWSAEMFLMFSLARTDIFSFGDWGLMQAIKTHYKVNHKDKKKLEKLASKWSPHRTTAAIILWHHKDNSPNKK